MNQKITIKTGTLFIPARSFDFFVMANNELVTWVCGWRVDCRHAMANQRKKLEAKSKDYKRESKSVNNCAPRASNNVHVVIDCK